MTTELMEAGVIAPGSSLTNESMEQREQSDACIESAESRQKTESQGTQELSDDDLDKAAGGFTIYINVNDRYYR